MKPSPVIFFGTPGFAVESLRVLHQSGGRKVALVVTQPDKPQGRGRKVVPTPVKQYCQENGLLFTQPQRMKSAEFLNQLRQAEASLFVVAAFGRILPQELLSIPKLVINVHASLLPRWRGAAPIARAIMAGDAQTGVTIMKIVQELDAGPVLLKRAIDIGANETEGELRKRLAKVGGEVLLESLAKLDAGDTLFTEQNESLVTYAPPIKKEESQIRWDLPALEVHNRIRALNPNPGGFILDQGKRIKIWKTLVANEDEVNEMQPGDLRVESSQIWVACKDRFLKILEIQKEGKGRQEPKSFLSGYPWSERKSWKE